MPNYKWFGCCGIADAKIETRNVGVETGRAERVKPRTLCKTKPQWVRHPGASQRVKGRPPAALSFVRLRVLHPPPKVASTDAGSAIRLVGPTRPLLIHLAN